jgi:hypothetical protein
MRPAITMTSTLLLCGLAATALAGDATGKWSGKVKLPNGQELPFVAHLKQQGARVTGTLDGINGAPAVTISDGRNDNDNVTFAGVRKINGTEVKFKYSGRLDGDSLDISITRADGSGVPLETHTRRTPE